MGFRNYSAAAAVILIICMIIAYVQMRYRPKLPLHLQGGADPKFHRVGRAFKKLIDDGMYGGAFAVYYQGKPVVDLWGGYRELENRTKWKEDTITMVMSTTKAVGAVCIGLLVDRGFIDYDAPVSKYWPEFAQHGKGEVTVRTLLNHEAGLAALDEPVDLKDLTENPQKVGRILAAQEPNWEPGTAHGYHGFTHGMYVDQLIRHTDPKQRGVREFFREEIAVPFGIDFFIGLPKDEFHRAAVGYNSIAHGVFDAISSQSWGMCQCMYNGLFFSNSFIARALASVKSSMAIDHNSNEYRSTPLASATGMGTARALAKLFGIVANGGKMEDRTLLSEKVIKEFQNPCKTRTDLILYLETAYALGMLTRKSPEGNLLFGHHGHGGQYAYVDIHRQLAWAFVTTDLRSYQPDRDPRHQILLDALYDSFN